MRSVLTYIVSVSLFGGLLLGCSDDDSGQTDSDLTIIDLPVGSENRYLYTVTMDSSGVSVETYRDTFAVRVEALDQTIGTYTGLIKIRAFDIGNDSIFSYSWYSQTSAGLTDIAYQFAGRVPVIMPKGSDVHVRHILQRHSPYVALQMLLDRYGIVSDTTVREDVRTVYQYPLSKGKSWTSFSDPFFSARKVIGKETVTLAAGTFHCTKIATTIPAWAPTLEWVDFVTRKGLMRRTISDSLVKTSQDFPEQSGDKARITMDLQFIERRE